MTLNRHTHYCLEFAANHIRFKQTFSLSSVFERAIITAITACQEKHFLSSGKVFTVFYI